jgi:hypothetical protein
MKKAIINVLGACVCYLRTDGNGEISATWVLKGSFPLKKKTHLRSEILPPIYQGREHRYRVYIYIYIYGRDQLHNTFVFVHRIKQDLSIKGSWIKRVGRCHDDTEFVT